MYGSLLKGCVLQGAQCFCTELLEHWSKGQGWKWELAPMLASLAGVFMLLVTVLLKTHRHL